jgi:putative transposase
MPGVEIVEKNIQVDHIHLVAIIPPKYAISDVVGRIKQYTAESLRKKFVFLKKAYWKEQVVWSEGYFVSSVGDINEKQIISYVKWQQNHGLGQIQLKL